MNEETGKVTVMHHRRTIANRSSGMDSATQANETATINSVSQHEQLFGGRKYNSHRQVFDSQLRKTNMSRTQ